MNPDLTILSKYVGSIILGQPDNHEMQHLRIKKHWYWFLHDAGIAIAIVIVALVFFGLAVAMLDTLLLALSGLLALVGVPYLALEIYQFNNSYFECTKSDILSHLKTVMTFDDTTLHYYLIREVNVHQSPLGSILGFAQIDINAGDMTKIVLPYVVNYQQIKEYLIPRIGEKSSIGESSVVIDEKGELKELQEQLA
jgi:hypothetical protein